MAPKRVKLPNVSTKSKLVTALNKRRWAMTREQRARQAIAVQKQVFKSQVPMRGDEHVFFSGSSARSSRAVGSTAAGCLTDIGIVTAAFVFKDDHAQRASGFNRMSVLRSKSVGSEAAYDVSSGKFVEIMQSPTSCKCLKHSFDGTPAKLRDEDGSLVSRRVSAMIGELPGLPFGNVCCACILFSTCGDRCFVSHVHLRSARGILNQRLYYNCGDGIKGSYCMPAGECGGTDACSSYECIERIVPELSIDSLKNYCQFTTWPLHCVVRPFGDLIIKLRACRARIGREMCSGAALRP